MRTTKSVDAEHLQLDNLCLLHILTMQYYCKICVAFEQLHLFQL